MSVSNKTPAATYVTKTNIAFPGSEAQADAMQTAAAVDLVAELGPRVTAVTITANSVPLESGAPRA